MKKISISPAVRGTLSIQDTRQPIKKLYHNKHRAFFFFTKPDKSSNFNIKAAIIGIGGRLNLSGLGFRVVKYPVLITLQETKGQETEQVKVKQRYLNEWIQAVNAHGGFGKWCAAVAKGPGEIKDVLMKTKL